MAELFLKFINKNGEEQEVCVGQEEFIIGRHSENDLSIVNSKLSREHIKIQRFADVFIVTDLGSSNGTKLNGKDLDEPVALRNGDVLNLGGGIEMEVELDDPNAQNDSSGEGEEKDSEKSASVSAGTNSAGLSSSANVSGVSNQSSVGSGIGKAFILAPILGFFLLFIMVGAIFLIGGKSNTEVAQTDGTDGGFISTSTPKNKDEGNNNGNPNGTNEPVIETPNTNDTPQTNGTNSEPIPNDTSSTIDVNEDKSDTTPAINESDEIGKIRGNSFRFMRKISSSGNKTVLGSNQLILLENKIKPFRNSSALASNITNAQKNASGIQELARAKKLQPQFLATAALAKLGNQSGDVLAKAREMADILDKLNIQTSGEVADENLIVIAVYDQGERGKFEDIANTLQKLGRKNPDRISEVRTIWFLKEKGEISDTQFELTLRFLAIGTITQNPKAFNVNAEALILN